jgi:hypothetical protein
MHVDDFERTWSALANCPIDQRRQRGMATLFEPSTDLEPGERCPIMRETF